MKRAAMFSLPMALVLLRLVAGPVYLASGSVPISPVQLGVLLLIAGTDLIDGRIARAWKVTSQLGRFLDPIADRTMMAAVLIKLTLAGVLDWWVIVLVGLQYIALASVFLIYRHRIGTPPPRDIWAMIGAALAAGTGVIGLTTTWRTPTLLLAIAFVGANFGYCWAVGSRGLKIAPKVHV